MLVLSTGCVSAEEAGRVAEENSPHMQLATSVGVEVDANTARMVLHVTNPSDQPVILEFANAQRYDFVVRTPEGAEVWRWSADRMFAQARGSETLAPGGTLQFSESWNFGERRGSYVVVAQLKATDHSVEESAPFQIRP